MRKILKVFISLLFVLILVLFFGTRIYKQAVPAFSPSEESDVQNYVYLSEDTVILDETLPEEELLKQLEKAISERAEHLVIRDHPLFEWNDLLSLDYSSFWLQEFGTATYPSSRLPEDREDHTLYFYEMTYYPLSEEEITKMKAEIDSAVNEILSAVPENADIWEKTKAVHDMLCQRTEYDETLVLPHCHNAYGALVNGKAVCSGYAAAFRILMGKLGVECSITVSEDHAWNHIDANTYESYIDVTWDDIDASEEEQEHIFYDFFGLTKEEVERIDMHTILNGGEEEEITGEPAVFNYFRHEGLYMEEYDREELIALLRRQLQEEKELLSVRISEEGYETLRSLSGEELGEILYEAGKGGYFYYWFNDDLCVLNIDPETD
ncbi:MAG: hypothetical protein IJJ30_00260 [Erysipelotrichaceae bacterium]|nr:hypothetical protein [Erysipelotrichaceae bacterium]